MITRRHALNLGATERVRSASGSIAIVQVAVAYVAGERVHGRNTGPDRPV
jgi:hypothetical protein